MAQRINISIPDELGREIQTWGGLLNISRICRNAILHEINRLKDERLKRRRFVQKVKAEILRRKALLISLANGEMSVDPAHVMDDTDRIHIQSYLERGELPEKPGDIRQLMKVYAGSCLSQSMIRRRLIRVMGSIPTPETIPLCLEKVFDEPDFADNRHWTPEAMSELTADLEKRERVEGADLRSASLRSRIIAILKDGSLLLEKELGHGLAPFYREISTAIENGPEETWKYAQHFAGFIRHVGPATVCDFLKNLGFSDFVRVEGHFKSEFPRLINEGKLTVKQQFIMSLTLCEELEMKPFVFDHIMYQWGRYKPCLQDIGH